MNCQGCNNIINSDELINHQSTCVLYLYKIKYNNNINNNLLINIIDLISIFKLYKIKSIAKNDLIIKLKYEYNIRKSLNILDDSSYIIIEYIYNNIYNNIQQKYTMYNLIEIISDIYNIQTNYIFDILQIYIQARNAFIC